MINQVICKDSIINGLFNGQSTNDVIILVICGFLGLLGSCLVELIRHKNDVKDKGGFSAGYWIKDNFARVLLSILITSIGVLYSKELVGIEVGNKGAMAVGFLSDKIIETLLSLDTNNIVGNLFKPKN